MGRSIVCFSMSLVAPPAMAVELLMFEERGCSYCAQWNEEVGPIYPKTDEAACAPLRRVDLGSTSPATLGVTRPVTFTPTFVLLAEGREIGRIQGYPGDMHFWGLLDMLIDKLPDTMCATKMRG